MTPEEYQLLLASQRPRKRRLDPMWSFTHQRAGFLEEDPFNSTFLNDDQPFIGKSHPFNKKNNPFRL